MTGAKGKKNTASAGGGSDVKSEERIEKRTNGNSRMRKIKYIVLHCTATNQHGVTVKAIQNYWKNQLGWKNPGYHFIIEFDGKIHQLQPIEKPSNGVRGYNQNSIHISYIGGVDQEGEPNDNRTITQKAAMQGLVHGLSAVYPNAEILGHRDFPGVNKACPSFEVKDWIKQLEL